MGSNTYDSYIEGNLKYAIDTEGSVTAIRKFAFYMCEILVASFPNVTQIGSSAFEGCSNLRIANFPELIALDSTQYNAFASCSNLTVINMPKLNLVQSYAFRGCHALSTISFPSLTCISGGAFYGCDMLLSLYLLGSTFCSCNTAKYVFDHTPLYNYTSVAGRWGSIYIPTSMWEQYRGDTGWSWVRSRFVSINVE